MTKKESAEPASCFVVLLLLGLFSAFDAMDATLGVVLTEFFAISFTSFQSSFGNGEAGGMAEGCGAPGRREARSSNILQQIQRKINT